MAAIDPALTERQVTALDETRWTIRLVRTGVPDPVQHRWTGPIFQVRRMLAAIAYRRAHRTDWDLVLHPGWGHGNGRFDPQVLKETLPDAQSAIARADTLLHAIRSGGLDDLLEGREPDVGEAPDPWLF